MTAQILRSKNLATRFQILVEIAEHQPDVQQRDIAQRLQITAQAVSEYIKELIRDRWVVSLGRSKYRITQEGVNWILSSLGEIKQYADLVQRAVTSITVSTAIAHKRLRRGQQVVLFMEDGMLQASPGDTGAARGIAVADVDKGEDVGITSIEGIVEIPPVTITIVRIPDIKNGGSRVCDLDKLRSLVSKTGMTGVIGLESLVALGKCGVEPDYRFGVREALIEAAFCGISSLLLCVESQLPDLLQEIESKNIAYEFVTFAKPSECSPVKI